MTPPRSPPASGGVPAVVNNSTVPDTRAPRLTAASVNAAGTQITLAFSENLSTSVPAASVFSAFMGGESLTIGSVTQPTANLNQIVLAVTPTIPRDGPVSVTYARSVHREQDPGRGRQRDREFHHRPRRSRGHEQLHPEWRLAAHERGRGPGGAQHDGAFGFLERGDRRGHLRRPLPSASSPLSVDPEWTMETGAHRHVEGTHGSCCENTRHLVQVRAVAAGMTAGPWSATTCRCVTNPPAEEVLANFPLVPAGLGHGDSFRALFLTSEILTNGYGGLDQYHFSAGNEAIAAGLDALVCRGRLGHEDSGSAR